MIKHRSGVRPSLPSSIYSDKHKKLNSVIFSEKNEIFLLVGNAFCSTNKSLNQIELLQQKHARVFSCGELLTNGYVDSRLTQEYKTFTYSFDLDGEVLQFALEPVLDLLHAGRLGLRGLQLGLQLHDLGVHLALELFHFLRANSALAALGLVTPDRHLVVRFRQHSLEVAATLLLLFQLLAQLVQIRLTPVSKIPVNTQLFSSIGRTDLKTKDVSLVA